jgi:hypothetical protein
MWRNRLHARSGLHRHARARPDGSVAAVDGRPEASRGPRRSAPSPPASLPRWKPTTRRRPSSRAASSRRGRELRPRPWRRGDRRHHLLHQHLQPLGADRRGPARPQRQPARPQDRSPGSRPRSLPGSQVVAEYLAKAGLQKELDQLGFNLVGFGCTTCIGNSGPLPAPISKTINDQGPDRGGGALGQPQLRGPRLA